MPFALLLRSCQFDKNMFQVDRQGRIRRDGVERQLAKTVDEMLAIRGFDGHGRLRKREDSTSPGDEVRRMSRQLCQSIVGDPYHQGAGETGADLIPVQVQIGQRAKTVFRREQAAFQAMQKEEAGLEVGLCHGKDVLQRLVRGSSKVKPRYGVAVTAKCRGKSIRQTMAKH